MKNKYILSIFILGMIVVFIGALMKINHVQFMEMNIGNVMILKGVFLEVLAGILLIWKLLKNKNPTSILNK
jgi:hypothetical protein